MTKVQRLQTPSGETLVVMSLEDYEDLVDTLSVREARETWLTSGGDTLSAADVAALLAAPSPLAFWRAKRGLSISDLAAATGLPEADLTEMETVGSVIPAEVLPRLAEALAVAADDLSISE